MTPAAVLHPAQVRHHAAIAAGQRFWGYLETEPFQTRYALAAYFVREARHIVEIGGYRRNAITHFLGEPHESVTVYSLDVEFEAQEWDTLQGAPCRVRHLRAPFQGHPCPTDGLAVVALGLEVVGDPAPFYALARRAERVVIEVPIEYGPSVRGLRELLAAVPLAVRCHVALDLSENAAAWAPRADSSVTRPYWRRDLYVLEPAR